MSLINSTAIPNGAAFEIDQSLRFDEGDSYNLGQGRELTKTLASAGNRRTWTYSCWHKPQVKPAYDGGGNLFFAGASSGTYFTMNHDTNGKINLHEHNGSAYVLRRKTTQVFRDPSSWYHFLLAVDTTQGTAANRVKLYVNGVQITAFDRTDNPSQNYDTRINFTDKHYIGGSSWTNGYLNGYLAEINFIEGAAKAPADFGETGDYGEWKPIEYSGSYGTNGFYLTFGSGAIMSASGGNSTATDGNFKAASFTANGTFTPSADGYVEYLVIAGGGAGSADGSTTNGNGGGGAGGYRTGMLAVTASTGYAITVGAGGVGALSASGVNGANSVFSTITSTGGGGGGYYINTAGAAGGSGGGGGVNSGAGGAASPAGQGFAGQAGSSGQGGGGGGAAEAGGTDGTGQGGDGLASSITGSAVTRAGGGGGSRASGGARSGGTGGGGAGGNGGAGTSGTANTGGGGGAGVSGGTSGSGGTGIVIIRYKFQ